MKNILKNARSGNEQDLIKAAELIKTLKRNEEGLFISGEIDENIFTAGQLLYPVYMEYETKMNKKAGYGDIAAQLTLLGKNLETSYQLTFAAFYLKLLTDVLAVMSPEIYEHYKTLVNLLKKSVKLLIEKENLYMTLFPQIKLKGDRKIEDLEDYHMAGEAILSACEGKLILSEKYEPLGKELVIL